MSDSTSQNGQAQPPAHCPICRKPVEVRGKEFPFCSSRCRMIDLGKWLGGDYLVSRPIEQSDLDEE
ncbi:MAG: DNA gyrase inhibitor YacG [Phycisphaeraceae bacterium]|nr:DNA gyrase inhibitor YacG [Phycisphaeraceae bacterium]